MARAQVLESHSPELHPWFSTFPSCVSLGKFLTLSVSSSSKCVVWKENEIAQLKALDWYQQMVTVIIKG